MLRHRVIPCLLLHNGGLVKTMKFREPKYVGDPINAVKIFNDKEVDELVILDIDASREKRGPNLELLSKINREAFMPLGYGGGISTVEQVRAVLNLGFEKVVLNTAALDNPGLVTAAAGECGSQSVVVCIDAKKGFLGKYGVYSHATGKTLSREPGEYAAELGRLGAGEIVINSVDKDGTLSGYDLELIKRVASSVKIPVVAMGGANSVSDLAAAIKIGGASAVSAGAFFVFHGPHRAVLITYPSKTELKKSAGEVNINPIQMPQFVL
ncbi:MAG: AglZ/HisF2 family acetamidino modification protein [Methanobacteriota archaeon]